MATIQDQLEHEHNMIYRGVERYRSQQAAAQEGRNEESSAGSTLLRHYVLAVSDQIQLYLDGKHPEGRRRGKAAKLMDTINTDKIALIALRSILNAFYSPRSLTSLCVSVGSRCEDELRFVHFQTEHQAYYDSLIRDFENKKLVNYNHKRSVLKAKGTDQGLVWVDWSTEDKADVGGVVLSLLMEVCDLVERENTLDSKRRTEVHIVPTQACIDWIENHDAAVEIVSPDRMPCLIPPMDWVSNTDGGFYSPELRGRTPLIKANYNEKARVELYSKADMPGVLKAINAMQNTGWRVNARVHATMQYIWANNLECGMPRSEPLIFPECPVTREIDVNTLPETSELLEAFMDWKGQMRELHTMEKDRRSKNLALLRTMRLANELKDKEEFFYVYQTDFRGRVYATASGLNPQGTDHSKALIEFSEGKALGDQRGFHWFMVNGANKYGFDKASYDQRVAWVYEHAEEFISAGTDPIGHRNVWTAADKPFQFLAWCMEFADCMSLDDHRAFVSHLPVGLDGSCNGLQHFSAMLSDSVGGAAVNLIPSDLPADIYQRVGDVAYAKLKAMDDPAAQNWIWMLGDSMPRSLVKPPVMTLPYGSTQQSCTSTTYKWLKEKAERQFPENTAFKQSVFLTPILWESIGEVVIAARAAMQWIQDCSSVISKAGHDIQYTSPLGFPVLQRRMRYTSKQIETQIGGRLRIRVGTSTDKVDVTKQRQGSSPNLVHHADATHMMMCILRCTEEGISSFAMIHDDFGTHACDAEKMQQIIAETFVDLHSNNDVLADFKQAHEERHDIVLPALPERGDLNIHDVLNSKYFFG
jgi:DNA-directed RNA polymerase